MKKEKEKFKIYLIYDESSYGGEICQGQEDSDWPSYEDEYNEFHIKGLKLQAPEWSETIELDFDPSELDHLYVVVVRYSSGSTFGATHGHWYIPGAYKTYAEAENVEMSIEKSTGAYAKDKNVYRPWEGYFESLEGVSVERVSIWK